MDRLDKELIALKEVYGYKFTDKRAKWARYLLRKNNRTIYEKDIEEWILVRKDAPTIPDLYKLSKSVEPNN